MRSVGILACIEELPSYLPYSVTPAASKWAIVKQPGGRSYSLGPDRIACGINDFFVLRIWM